MNRIPAKPTEYKGYLFRSKLETIWALFFDSLSVEWKYESQKFKYLKTSYLPDFYLPELGLWVEIKPKQPTTLERNKAQSVSDQTGQAVLIFAGFPNIQRYRHPVKGCVNLELSDAYAMMCLPNMGNKIVFGANELYHMVPGDYKLQLLLIFIVFQVPRQKFTEAKLIDLLTMAFVETQIENNETTRYEWHDHLNKAIVNSTHTFINHLAEHVESGVQNLKSELIKKIEQGKIQKMLQKVTKKKSGWRRNPKIR